MHDPRVRREPNVCSVLESAPGSTSQHFTTRLQIQPAFCSFCTTGDLRWHVASSVFVVWTLSLTKLAKGETTEASTLGWRVTLGRRHSRFSARICTMCGLLRESAGREACATQPAVLALLQSCESPLGDLRAPCSTFVSINPEATSCVFSK